MPHTMPMLWIMIYFYTLFSLMIIISLLYFFFMPNTKSALSSKKTMPLHKWIWSW